MALVRELSFALLNDAEESYKQNGKFLEEVLQSLHDVFGEVFVKSADFLETGEVVRYETPNAIRAVLKVGNKKEVYTLFDDINFCHCGTFARVLSGEGLLTCEHVLAARLARISGRMKVNRLTDLQYVEFVSDLVDYIKE
ncbi:hypothetical protein PPYR_03300 [Photinus pyralis]|uniref:SWIM-type domain-containing protein n=1 Tax=Photinus pyralis TaxID=7054 RepID=A0A1Y1JWE1_PHOPY|nr:uncharacterized protein LOC116161058 [Photinus pyralis]KAB0791500.1 hypothetical protein PPYR_03300 [Photinus pyralis]